MSKLKFVEIPTNISEKDAFSLVNEQPVQAVNLITKAVKTINDYEESDISTSKKLEALTKKVENCLQKVKPLPFKFS